MRAIIIGGSGHVGTYLVPRLVESGYEVINISRGNRKPYRPHSAWNHVERISMNRTEKESSGTFSREIVKLKPDIVIDMICFTKLSAQHLVESLRGHIGHFLHCGTIWVHGHSTVVPTTENQPRQPFGDYGIQKAAIEAYLLHEARQNGFPVTILHPGHIVGPGWVPLNPAGHFNLSVFQQFAAGKPITLPNLGMETVHHVHADDVAQAFKKAIDNWGTARGENFHVVSPQALTLKGYAEAMYAWFDKTPDVRFKPWEEWRKTVSEEDAEMTWDHIAHSPNCSIEKAKRLIGYNSRYTSLDAVYEALDWFITQGSIKVP